MKKKILVCILLFAVTAAFYGEETEPVEYGSVGGYIKTINIKETGYILITFKEGKTFPVACKNNNATVVIKHSHIAKKEMLSTITLAFALGKRVGFWVHGTYSAYGLEYPVAVTASITNK